MSDEPLGPPSPSWTPEQRAQHIARTYQALADSLANVAPNEAARVHRLAKALSLGEGAGAGDRPVSDSDALQRILDGVAEIRRLQDQEHRELTAIRDRLGRLELAVLALAREMGTRRVRLDHSGPDSPAGREPWA